MLRRTFLTATAVMVGAVGTAIPALAGSQAPSKPLVTVAEHTGSLRGSVAVTETSAALTAGTLTGTIALEVDQTGVTSPIVFANLDLPSSFTWTGADSVTVRSDEANDITGAQTVTPSFGGSSLTVKGLSFTDTDGDGAVEFSLSATGADVATTITAPGNFAISSQYRTNATRKVKEQSWVLSTAGAIAITEGPTQPTGLTLVYTPSADFPEELQYCANAPDNTSSTCQYPFTARLSGNQQATNNQPNVKPGDLFNVTLDAFAKRVYTRVGPGAGITCQQRAGGAVVGSESGLTSLLNFGDWTGGGANSDLIRSHWFTRCSLAPGVTHAFFYAEYATAP